MFILVIYTTVINIQKIFANKNIKNKKYIKIYANRLTDLRKCDNMESLKTCTCTEQ